VLRKHAETHRDQFMTANLTPTEAYCCYMVYIRPRLTYPVACTSMTEKQCRHIQAPAVEAILPKLHLNRHTSHALLFAGERYGGVGFPAEYTDQGFNQMKMLVGHLKLGDDNGSLIRCLVTHTQLQTGSVTPFFQLPYQKYASWVDRTWVSSIWEFASRFKMKLDIENHWVPKVSWEKDVAIMDIALLHDFQGGQLQMINTCRMYLQVITLSDIATAKGDRILQVVMEGKRHDQRHSELLWPVISRPPERFWAQWCLFLVYIAMGTRIFHPLGNWLKPSNQTWHWYHAPGDFLYEYKHCTEQCVVYLPRHRRAALH